MIKLKVLRYNRVLVILQHFFVVWQEIPGLQVFPQILAEIFLNGDQVFAEIL